MSRLFHCFLQPSATASTPHPSDTLRAFHSDTPSQTFHSAPTLSSQHRNNGYEDLTLHFTQSENLVREQRRGRDGHGHGHGHGHGDRREEVRLRVLPCGREGRGGRVGQERERGDVIGFENKNTRERGEKGVESKIKEEFGDDILELRLNMDGEGGNGGGGGGGEQEVRLVTITRKKPVSEAAAGVQGEGGTQGESVEMGRRKGRDYCTPEERRRVEKWITGCERARSRGFVKRVREATGLSGENSSGGHSSGDGDGKENMDYGPMRLRGGDLAPGWPEWGSGWDAYKFMT